MEVQHKVSGEVFTATEFDGTQFGAVVKAIPEGEHPVPEKEYLMFEVELDSPSGDKVVMDVQPGAFILEDAEGDRRACPKDRFHDEFEEVV